MSPTLAAATRMGAVHLDTGDLGRAVEFYTSRLGLALLSRQGDSAWLGAADERLLELHAVAGARAARGTTGLYHLALVVPSRPALGRVLRHFLESRTPLQGASDHGVSEALYLADPEGNGIEVYRDRPRGEWPFRGGALQMTLDPLDAEAVLAVAEPGGAWAGMEAGTHMGHVHLRVRDIAESHDFYCGVLGFDEMQRMGGSALFVSAGGYHHHLGLNTWHSAGAPPQPGGVAGLRRYDVRVPGEGEVRRAGDRLSAAGHPVTGIEGGIQVTDPSGIALAILAP